MIPALAIRSSFTWVSLWHPSIILLFVFNASLLSISTRGSRLMLYIYFPSLKNERQILETEIWVLGSRPFPAPRQVLSCPLCSTPTKVSWPIRDTAMTANDQVKGSNKTRGQCQSWYRKLQWGHGSASFWVTCLMQNPAPLHCPEAAAPA